MKKHHVLAIFLTREAVLALGRLPVRTAWQSAFVVRFWVSQLAMAISLLANVLGNVLLASFLVDATITILYLAALARAWVVVVRGLRSVDSNRSCESVPNGPVSRGDH